MKRSWYIKRQMFPFEFSDEKKINECRIEICFAIDGYAIVNTMT